MVVRNEFEETCETTALDCDLEVEHDSGRRERFRVRDYVPKYYDHRKIFNLRNITSLLIILLLIVVIIMLAANSRNTNSGEHASSTTSLIVSSTVAPKSNDTEITTPASTDNTSVENESEYFYEIILSDLSRLWAYKVSTSSLYILHKFKKNITTLEVHPENAIFSVYQNESKIINFPYDGISYNELSTFFEESRIKPQVLAFDDVGENLYVADNITGSLVVISVRNLKHDILMTDLSNVCDIDLDPERGLMFILQCSESILKTKMDGTLIMEMSAHKLMTAMTLDRKNKRIYWLNEHAGIQILNYYGHSIGKIEMDHTDIVNIAILDDRLFWLWVQHDGIESARHHLVYCQIKFFNCENHEMHKIDHPMDFKLMKVVRYGNQTENLSKPVKYHPCQVSNGDCEHLCLVVPDGKRTCACNVGWQLNPDKKTCREVKDFILYTYGGFFRARTLDVSKSTSIDVIWPTPTLMNEDKEIFFDYDFSNDDLYYSQGGNILVTKVRANWIRPKVVVKVDKFEVKDLAFDWKTGDLYYIRRNPIENDSIELFNTNGRTITGNNTIFICDTRYSAHKCLKCLTIDPYRGYLYYMMNGSSGIYVIINRITKTNSNPTRIEGEAPYNFVSKFRHLAVDPRADEIYWIRETRFSEIKRANINGTDKSDFYLETKISMQTINVYRNWIFISTNYSIWRFDKETGQMGVELKLSWNANKGKKVVSDVRVISDIRDKMNAGS